MGDKQIDLLVGAIKLLIAFICGMLVTNMYGYTAQPFFIWGAVLGILFGSLIKLNNKNTREEKLK